MYRPVWRVCAFCCLLLLSTGVAGQQSSYLTELIERADALRLADDPAWHALLHYRPGLLVPGVKSEADDPAFFTAPDGKTNPAAELAGTLAVFFSDASAADEQPPQCRFIARYHWLKERLDFDDERLPPQACRRFDEWYGALNPEGLTLVFPVSYLNNPASMFGHTLLRVDAKGRTENTRLLDYAINYAAVVGNDGGIAFAIKGLFGGYAGQFSLMPYYLKVREYNDMENRDIWEYRLNFTEQETRRLLMHLWELRGIRFDYYFFDENCSYHLLSLFEIARPGLQLTNQFVWWAIPSDTVRAIVAEQDIVRDVVYRPAASTRMVHRIRAMPEARQEIARALADGELSLDSAVYTALPAADRAAVLELTDEYLQYELAAGNRDSAVVEPLMQQLLVARSAIDTDYRPVAIETPAVRPDQGHGTARLAVGFGSDDGEAFQELRIRPAYHDLLDADGGYTPGAEISFFDLTLRFRDDADTLALEDFTPLGIVSLAPRDRFLRPVSWKVRGAATRSRMADGDEPLVFRLEGGPGLAVEAGEDILLFGFVEGSLDVSGHLEKNFALGIGPSAGILWTFGERVKTMATLRLLRYGPGDTHTRADLGLWQNVHLDHSVALRYGVTRQRQHDRYWTEGQLSLLYYF